MIRPLEKPIYVTQPFLPPFKEFSDYLMDIWDRKRLTNNGKYHQDLEAELCKFLGVKHVSLFTNGTLALIVALRALRISGEVITTPFSFVATTHSLWWNSIRPVFADVDQGTYNLDPKKIESLITPKTTAILAVHLYGNPCDVEKISEIASTYGLKVIYDACHAFGVTIDGRSVLEFGDLSVLSFHATKVFSTFEGGAIISHDAVTKKRIDCLKNFGFAGETKVVGPGINAKMNEFQAALGLLQLKYFQEAVRKRSVIADLYRRKLADLRGLTFLETRIPGAVLCHQHFPIFINQDEFGISRDELFESLKANNVFGRRYFYPLISQFPLYKDLDSAAPGRMPVAERVTKEVLCLPIYSDLEPEIACRIVDLVRDFGAR